MVWYSLSPRLPRPTCRWVKQTARATPSSLSTSRSSLPLLSLRPDLTVALPGVVALLAASALFPFAAGAMRTHEEILGWMSEDRSSCAPTQVSANL